jgi:hypothetical protein
MSKTAKTILGISVLVLVLLIGFSGWLAYKWAKNSMDVAVDAQGKEFFQEVKDFNASLSEVERAKFQECFQWLKGQEFAEKAQGIVQERMEKTCGDEDKINDMKSAQEFMSCSMSLGITIGLELSQEHFKVCKKQIGK